MNNTTSTIVASNPTDLVEIITHPFERAGLGKAPFRFVRHERMTYVACQGAPVQPGAACDYCGTGIHDVFFVRSADGKEFKVGCDCIKKTARKDNTADKKLMTASDKIVRDARNAAARARNAVKRQAQRERDAAALEVARQDLRTLLADSEAYAKLAAIPHPYGRDGGYAAYANWMSLNAGAGVHHVLKTCRESLA